MTTKKKHFPLLIRRNTACSETAYERLRALNAAYGFGNNYCLTFLLENLDDLVGKDKLDAL